jgi:hypothetical protein
MRHIHQFIFRFHARLASAALWSVLCMTVCCFGLSSRSASAAEQFKPFLDGLRDRKLFDMAMEYLDRMRNSPQLVTDVRQTIMYEEGCTLVEWSRDERDQATKKLHLDRAQQKFDEFIKANSAHPLAAMAATQMGNVLVERGDMLIQQAERQSAKKDELQKQARVYFDQALVVFKDAETKFGERTAVFKGMGFIDPKKEPQKIEDREQAHRDLIQAMLYVAGVQFETAKTWPEASPERKKLFDASAAKYAEVYDKYRTRLAGLLARIKQGQCYQETGDTKRALGAYGEILVQPDSQDEFRRLKALALHLAMQCWTGDKEKRPEEAITRGEEWLGKARGNEDRNPDWLAVRYYTAVAMKMHADTLKKEEQNQKDTLLAGARKHAQAVSRIQSEHQDKAEKLYRLLAGSSGADKEPANFAEAKERGDSELTEMQNKQQQAAIAPEMKDTENVPKYLKESLEARQKALKYFRLALSLRDGAVPMDDVNVVRYYVCFLEYQSGNFYDAAVMGEFLAKKYPQSVGARQGAKIALSAYLNGYNEAKEGERDFDNRHLHDIADYITKRWAGEAEADDAWKVLVAIATREHKMDKAMELLAKIPEASAGRGEAELAAGQALWSDFLSERRKDEKDGRKSQTELDTLKTQAQSTLESGVARLRKPVDEGGEVTYSLAAAALSLAQLYLDSSSNQPEKAAALLDDPKIGPVTLVSKKDPVILKGPNFAVETYKLALRAAVATQNIKRAQEIMKELDDLIKTGGDASAAETATRIYIMLGRELEEQITQLRRDPTKGDEIKKVSEGFEKFLQRISESEAGNTLSSLNWVAQTYYSLGNSFDTGGATLPPESLAYYEKSRATDEKILKAGTALAGFTDDSKLNVQLRQAKCMRRMKQFKAAVDLLEGVLKQKPMLLEAHKEAALCYEDWAGTKDPAGKVTYYDLAIKGARKSSKDKYGREENTIWGWNKLANMVARDKKFDEVFHEARFHLAQCHWLQSQEQKGTEKQATLQQAETDIIYTTRLKPDMGGEEMKRKYDNLVRTIQKALGRQATGLPQPKPPTATAPKTGTPAAATNTGAGAARASTN